MKRHWNAAAACALIGALLCVSIGASGGEFELRDGKWVRATEPVEGSEAGHLALIRKLLRDKEPRKALKSAERFLSTYPNSADREEAMLLGGQAEMGRGRYYQAFEWFEKLLAEFPAGRYYEWALTREFEVAEAFLAGKKRVVLKVFRMPAVDDGLEILLRIAEHAPGTAMAEKALMRIAEHHNSRGEYIRAVEAYDRFVEMFPKSEQAGYAALQAARASLAQFKGVEYDDTPLLEAEQRFRSFSEKYPAEADRENVSETLRHISETRASKLYATGDYYRRSGRSRSAAYYYRLVMKEFPETDWAARAEETLILLGTTVTAPRASGPPAKARPASAGADKEGGATK